MSLHRRIIITRRHSRPFHLRTAHIYLLACHSRADGPDEPLCPCSSSNSQARTKNYIVIVPGLRGQYPKIGFTNKGLSELILTPFPSRGNILTHQL